MRVDGMSRTCRAGSRVCEDRTSRTPSTPCGVTSYSRPSERHILRSCCHTRRRRTAGTAICSSGSFRCSHRRGAAGDPLGPLYFCLAVHDLLTSLQSSIVVGYLDDMSMGGRGRQGSGGLHSRLEAGAAKLSLTLNRSKCEVAGLTNATRSDSGRARG